MRHVLANRTCRKNPLPISSFSREFLCWVFPEKLAHRAPDSYDARWLTQAGIKTDCVRLGDLRLRGNAHEMTLEKNTHGIANFFANWPDKLDKNAH